MVHFTFAYRQFEFVNDSSDMEMGIGGQITALLKLEYPSLIKENPKKTFYANIAGARKKMSLIFTYSFILNMNCSSI